MNNPCQCVDCGGSKPGHSSDCTYMRELHGEPENSMLDFVDEVCMPSPTSSFYKSMIEVLRQKQPMKVICTSLRRRTKGERKGNKNGRWSRQ